MPTITLTNPVALTPGVASLHATNMTILQNLLNAGLDSANFASGLIFPSSQLMQVSADTRHVIGWNGSQWGPMLVPTRFFDTTLGGSAATIDITNIPQTHQGLLCLAYVRGDDTTDGLYARVNGDTGSNYDIQILNGAAATAGSSETFATNNGMFGFPVTRSAAPANVFTAIVFHIPNYANAVNNTSGVGLSAFKQGTTTGQLEVRITSSFWRSNAAVTQLTIRNQAGNFVAGSRVTLWGMP